jgi:hypothetical protein
LIRRFLDDTGVWNEGDKLKSHVTNHLAQLFTSYEPTSDLGMLDSVHVRLSAATNDTLSGLFTTDVVNKALFVLGI